MASMGIALILGAFSLPHIGMHDWQALSGFSATFGILFLIAPALGSRSG